MMEAAVCEQCEWQQAEHIAPRDTFGQYVGDRYVLPQTLCGVPVKSVVTGGAVDLIFTDTAVTTHSFYFQTHSSHCSCAPNHSM